MEEVDQEERKKKERIEKESERVVVAARIHVVCKACPLPRKAEEIYGIC